MTTTRGLEGVVATQSAISSIIDATLTYVGYDIDDLAVNASFEEVVFLLWNKRLPKANELEELKQLLANNMAVQLDGKPLTIIGHQRGLDTKENIKRNFGMPHPEMYSIPRSVHRMMNKCTIEINDWSI